MRHILADAKVLLVFPLQEQPEPVQPYFRSGTICLHLWDMHC